MAAAPTPGNRRRADRGPLMRIAVCGGVYANPYALRAFIDDARVRGAERLFCLGDLGGFGAEMDALWPLLREHGIECIAGNYDVAIARGDTDCGCGYTDARDNAYSQVIYDHTRAHTGAEFAAWMATLNTQRRLQIEGTDVHLVHGSPLELADFWWESRTDSEHAERVAASGADVILCTHSGLPWQRRFARHVGDGGAVGRVRDTLVVNVGVIGKPANDGRREVWYAVLDLVDGQVSAELVPLAYDWAAQAASMRAAGLPELFVSTIETGWWTTCLEILPPVERSRGRYHLYRDALPTGFRPADSGASSEVSGEPAPGAATPPDASMRWDQCPVISLFGTEFFPSRLWIYTNFHCNLACDYCAVASSPTAVPRTLDLERFTALVDEAVAEGFTELYLTGGEPTMLEALPAMLASATGALPTVLLTNAMLLRGRRLDRLREVLVQPGLIVQTSLDGATALAHDAHRGAGSWARTMAGIETLVGLGARMRVGLTETPQNAHEIAAVAARMAQFGIVGADFAVRPLLRRGFAADDAGGLDIAESTTVPELTVSADGLHWHPAGADATSSPDMVLAKNPVSLAEGKRLVVERFLTARLADGTVPRPYRCAV
ncbi:MAG: radical SAM protein [Sporichthyaceae bacterium]